MTAQTNKRPAAIRLVIPFVFRHWLEQPARAAIVAGGFLGATMADLFMPVFSGHLVDALTLGASDPAARRAAFTAFGGIVALGLISMILRLTGLQAIVPFTLKIMSEVSPVWRISPLMRHAIQRSCGSSPVTTTGPSGQKVSMPFARVH